jgi:hypothetical protein
MSSIIELYTQKVPKTGKINNAGVDKTPIGVEQPFPGTKDLMKSDLDKPRHGKLGSGAGGYDNSKTYSSQIKK